MDEMTIGSMFMKKLIAKIIAKVMRKKLGYEADIQPNEFSITFDGDKAHIHLNTEIEMSKEEILKLIKQAGL